MNYLKNRPFLVIDTYVVPSKSSRTERKNWMKEPNAIDTQEHSYLVNKVSDNVLCRATAIIDLVAGKLVKSRFTDMDDTKIVSHYVQKYRSTVDQAMLNWGAQPN